MLSQHVSRRHEVAQEAQLAAAEQVVLVPHPVIGCARELRLMTCGDVCVNVLELIRELD